MSLDRNKKQRNLNIIPIKIKYLINNIISNLLLKYKLKKLKN